MRTPHGQSQPYRVKFFSFNRLQIFVRAPRSIIPLSVEGDAKTLARCICPEFHVATRGPLRVHKQGLAIPVFTAGRPPNEYHPLLRGGGGGSRVCESMWGMDVAASNNRLTKVRPGSTTLAQKRGGRPATGVPFLSNGIGCSRTSLGTSPPSALYWGAVTHPQWCQILSPKM